ncbi:diaminohydroxyphosphoribosylaminopyrimidine deaminase [Chitinophaga niabensis]|uniref:Riboflavin biosynthesis protein RibD n=2 Tax=Chitinophaga niabensis TaxID=536979 RepID=A0A1N6GB91_9BACT|nr:bifunctional diaminohydroxyphosphoribosylaminopyrimidine deaminase/5-amino-6-(5-phosphoribosylamino)uracil reductase RibD [Chitinophaga niabensis]SIO04819.1 diaminohydroxyphosphoribosylaminopyrimidine deaminase [Chitinophaga niabensis]
MQRCVDLSQTGMGAVAPNPMVGSVLVHEGRIIGEGFHRVYGQAHAEVNCINSVPEELQSLIPKATMYVSLEPCAHHGKTPPCADLIIARKIPKVVVGCVDTFSAVAGKGIQRMKDAGIEVITGVLEEACRAVNRRFFTFHEKKRPYIILKWAQSADGFIAPPDGQPVRISNPYTDRLVHQWRTREMAIMVGKHTALKDDPKLTARLWPGRQPLRIVIDRRLEVPGHYQLHSEEAPTIFVSEDTFDFSKDIIPQLLTRLHADNIQSMIVEGGAHLLQQFIDNVWDEARVITGKHALGGGLPAPVLHNALLQEELEVQGDLISMYTSST